ncbi:Bug family tripartite tricarboxylate transporter substrate binding protein [Sphaerotilus montanus]|uniref:Tripartite-type tricarboxylate transporter receptor subunit TctC n=1 Tax=Sphaerotilus montanus TaxID=522889 RepID=A0A7Y9R331_9BURK|nr:tripartite tricarboxylate transporter substrate binding protein [Sphaerotilus montanus]NYG35266.1 tripartite-type tricarboxylate transporter receptor subunit TctC [Sphaerotilus montanus]
MKLLKLIVTAALAVATAASAQEWPTKPIRLIIPYAAGSGPDIAMRPVADRLGQILKQAVVVDNIAGAGGIVGSQTLARAKPDGYTFGFGNNITLAVNKSFFDKLPYDPDKDFQPVGLLFDNPYILVARPTLKVGNLQELIAYVKANPGKANFASGTGVGSGSHLTGEMMRSQAGLDISHIPYKSGSQALSDLVNGSVDVLFDNVNGVQQFIKNGQIKPLAVTSAKRLPQFPDIPTMAESGFPGFEAVAWGGIIAPAGTPPAIVQRLNAAIAEALKSPEVVRANQTMALNPLASSTQEFSAFIAKESVKWARIVKTSGAKPE